MLMPFNNSPPIMHSSTPGSTQRPHSISFREAKPGKPQEVIKIKHGKSTTHKENNHEKTTRYYHRPVRPYGLRLCPGRGSHHGSSCFPALTGLYPELS